jgi:LemA protein
VNERVKTANQFESTLSKLLLISENYPDLKASTQFTGLRDSLTETENMIVVSRIRYNDAVRDYNLAVMTFPSNIFAGLFGFTQKEFFEISNEEAAKAPKVNIQIPGS